MSRIVAGAAGRHPLASVPGDGTRPTTDRVREALFSRLEALGVLQDARVLDLYAGSGALGVESASRGARSVELVEVDSRAAAVCRRNAELVNRILGRAVVTVHRGLVGAFLRRSSRVPEAQCWDLVFLDPPYVLDDPGLASALELLMPQLAAGAVVVVERSARTAEPAWPEALECFADKAYGETRLWFAQSR